MRANQEIAWMAGLIDGEGCIYARFTNVGKYEGNPSGTLEQRIEVHAASVRMIDEIQRIFEDHRIEYKREAPKMQPRSTRPAQRILVRKRESLVKFIDLILPHLRVKDREAKLMLDFLVKFPREYGETKSSDSDRAAYVNELKSLKRIA